jgi:hypothetical protein
MKLDWNWRCGLMRQTVKDIAGHAYKVGLYTVFQSLVCRSPVQDCLLMLLQMQGPELKETYKIPGDSVKLHFK